MYTWTNVPLNTADTWTNVPLNTADTWTNVPLNTADIWTNVPLNTADTWTNVPLNTADKANCEFCSLTNTNVWHSKNSEVTFTTCTHNVGPRVS